MELINTFTIPLSADEAFAVLTDFERVAVCMPGATLEEADGDEYRGSVKLRVGAVSLVYRGTARLVDVDAVARSARIEAAGQETRGTGTARADVQARCEEVGGQTLVTVVTRLDVTGRPAQFGRGIMRDVAGNLIDKFAANLAADLGTGQGETGPAREREESLNLLELAGAATARRLVPLGAAALLLVLLLRRVTRGRARDAR